jgi:two-component system alkaline phosphatase synthesis response regulator PhoP
MNDVLLIEATEDLQLLSGELGRAGFRVTPCSVEDALLRLSRGDLVDALLLNLLDGAALPGDRLKRDALPERTALIAIVRPDQIETVESEPAFDDFAVFPVHIEELALRIRRAAARRDGGEDAHLLHCGDLTIDQASYKVYVGSRPVELTYKEYELLRFLAQNEGKVSTRETLLNRVWGYDFYGGARTVDVHIRRLRSKIEDPQHSFIETVRNVGYRFHAQ